VIEAQKLCLENAEALIEDARLLFKNGRFPRSVALCVLSFEELGKIILLGGTLSYSSDEQWAKFWKRFRNHESKRRIVASIEADMWGLTEDERREESETEEFVERMKLLCLYVDSVDEKLYTPMGSFGSEIERISSNALKFAEGRAAMFRHFLSVVTPETSIELGKGVREILSHKHTNSASLENAVSGLLDRITRKHRESDRVLAETKTPSQTRPERSLAEK